MFKGALQIAFIFTKLLSQLQDLSQLQVTTPTYNMRRAYPHQLTVYFFTFLHQNLFKEINITAFLYKL